MNLPPMNFEVMKSIEFIPASFAKDFIEDMKLVEVTFAIMQMFENFIAFLANESFFAFQMQVFLMTSEDL